MIKNENFSMLYAGDHPDEVDNFLPDVANGPWKLSLTYIGREDTFLDVGAPDTPEKLKGCLKSDYFQYAFCIKI